MSIQLSGSERKELREVLLQAFGRNDLKRALSESDPPRKFDELVSATSFRNQTSELVGTAEEEGWLLQFLKIVEEERPQRQDLIAKIKTILENADQTPTAPPPEKVSTPHPSPLQQPHRPPLTKTTHTLPFEKLSALDFERLCLWLVRREGYTQAEHLGAAGSEQGRDIVAWQNDRRFVFQCKRVEKLDSGKAGQEIEKLRGLPEVDQPDELTFVVSSDVSALIRSRIRISWGDEATCHFWAGSELDERVKRYADILHEFFDLGSEGLKTLEPTTPTDPPSRYYSAYISYSRTDDDRAFAFKLYDRLKAEGVSCWLLDHDIDIGEVTLDASDRAIREAEKLLLCCSKTSLESPWVDEELEKAIEKERQHRPGKSLVLIPLKLDDHLTHWKSGKASIIRSRYPADFSGWEEDEGKFEAQYQRVLRALKLKEAREAPPPKL